VSAWLYLPPPTCSLLNSQSTTCCLLYARTRLSLSVCFVPLPLTHQPTPPLPKHNSYAAARGDARKLRLMMQSGFNPDSVDYDGRTALMLGCARGHPEVVSLLLQAGEY
jgi:ankyrin repeat protein